LWEYNPTVWDIYVKNHDLGLEVSYRYGSETRTYIPDFIVQIDDGHGKDDPLNLIVEIKGYRREDAQEKKSTMENYWVPGVNNHGSCGRWAFAEFSDVYEMQEDFEKEVKQKFNEMIDALDAREPTQQVPRSTEHQPDWNGRWNNAERETP